MRIVFFSTRGDGVWWPGVASRKTRPRAIPIVHIGYARGGVGARSGFRATPHKAEGHSQDKGEQKATFSTRSARHDRIAAYKLDTYCLVALQLTRQR